jgi:hypothetical protein
MFYLDVAYVAVTIYTRMFQMYVASVLSGCYICCSGHTHILQEYVLNISSISYTCCSKCFMLQVFHEQTRKVGAGRGGPASTMVPMHGKRSGRDSRRMRMVAAGGIGPASAAGAACNHAYEWLSERVLQPMDMRNNKAIRGTNGCRIDWWDEIQRAGVRTLAKPISKRATRNRSTSATNPINKGSPRSWHMMFRFFTSHPVSKAID